MDELITFKPAYAEFMVQFDAKPSDAGYFVDWYDSVAFCRWLGEQSGISDQDQAYLNPESLDKTAFPREPSPDANWAPRNWPLQIERPGFRLPTESEWEVASRGGTRTTYGFGSDTDILGRFGWFTNNSGKRVHPPRELRPSLRGLFDIYGNLYEWAHDWYGDYGVETKTDPLGIDDGSTRVFRGGGFFFDAATCRSAYRYRIDPMYRARDTTASAWP